MTPRYFLHSPDQVRLVNGVGSIDSTLSRRMVYEKFREKRYVFETVIHPSAIIAPEILIEDGVEIMAGAIVQPGVRLGPNVIINTGARVDHDCSINAHAHIAPGVTLSGNVHIAQGAHIGTGASIIQGIKVGESSVVGAGAVVISDVPAGDIVVGVPAQVSCKAGGGAVAGNCVMKNPVYIVHCIDTEGPLHESVEVTFERLRSIFHLELEPSVEILRRLQEGKVDLGGLEGAVQKVVDPHLLAYNDTWDKVDAMLAENYERIISQAGSTIRRGRAGSITGSALITLITI